MQLIRVPVSTGRLPTECNLVCRAVQSVIPHSVPSFHPRSLTKVASFFCVSILHRPTPPSSPRRRLAKRVAGVMEQHCGVSALTLVIQDGADAGQTVPHVHVHVLPRRKGDFEENDQVYDAIDAASQDQAAALRSHAEHHDKDVHVDAKTSEERVPRSAEDMAAEARKLRPLFG